MKKDTVYLDLTEKKKDISIIKGVLTALLLMHFDNDKYLSSKQQAKTAIKTVKKAKSKNIKRLKIKLSTKAAKRVEKNLDKTPFEVEKKTDKNTVLVFRF